MTAQKRAPKIVKTTLSIVVFAVAAFFVWNYLAGPLKHRRDMQAFAASLENCESFDRAIKMPVGGTSLNYMIDGLRDAQCSVQMETLGPHVIHCDFETGDLPEIAKGFSDLAQDVGIFGGVNIRISTSSPDPLTQALNSDACKTVVE